MDQFIRNKKKLIGSTIIEKKYWIELLSNDYKNKYE